MRPIISLQASIIVAASSLALSVGTASAGSDKPNTDDTPTFGTRIDKPDGSSAVTIGRRLDTDWDTKVGTDLKLAAPEATTASDNLRGMAAQRSSGAVWGNLTMPGVQPLGFDKTAIEARLDADKDQGKVGATLSRSIPLDPNFSLTLQNNYSVTQTLADTTTFTPRAAVPAAATPATSSLSAGETVRFNVNPSGTAFSAGAESSTADTQWHSKLSVEQTLLGPFKLTTSVENAGTTASKKSITAGFKRSW